MANQEMKPQADAAMPAIVKGLTVGLLQENCYIFGCAKTHKAVVIDPGDNARAILKVVRDSGLTHALLGLETVEAVLGHPVVGGSWEGFCIENLISAAPDGTEANFFRSSAGAELDLVLTLPGGAVWAIEIKRTSAPKVARGFHTAADDVGASERLLVYAGAQESPLSGGARAMPLYTAMMRLAAQTPPDRAAGGP